MSGLAFLLLAVIATVFIYNGFTVYTQAETIFQQIYALTSAGFGIVFAGIGIAIVYLGAIRHQAWRSARVLERMEDIWRQEAKQPPTSRREVRDHD